jgi:hypothetical protein
MDVLVQKSAAVEASEIRIGYASPQPGPLVAVGEADKS